MAKIFPRNLTARAAYRVTGNPDSTRLESGVGNCFPGLEYDHRNLDRRFMPGLTFEFISNDPTPTLALTRGARLVAQDLRDPGFTPATTASTEERTALNTLRAQINAARFDPDTQGWFISAITQGGVRIVLASTNDDGDVVPFDGLQVWRLVRSIEPGAVEIELTARTMPANTPLPQPVTLQGWRRHYTDPTTGVFSSAYRPGELTQSLCSPWQHDFRDCGCFYWASNHPDVVQVEDLPGDPILSGGESADPGRALTRVRWLRSDRSPDRTSEARESYRLNRPAEMDHYEINLRWQELLMILGNKEVSSTYRPRPQDSATPYTSADEMAQHIFELATLEHVLTLEYLYAYFSIHTPAEIPAGPQAQILREDVQFLRHFVLLVAVSEMQHLRWANQLLWELREGGFIDPKKYGPSLGVSPTVPVSEAGGTRPRALRPLTLATLKDFIAVERPSGQIEGQYSHVVATLRMDKKYPESLFQLASRIVNDGQQHFLRFRDLQSVMIQYKGTPWLRTVAVGSGDDAEVAVALKSYFDLIRNLRLAYATGSVTDRMHVTAARDAMDKLQTQSEALAAKGLGVPYF
jgi:Ferritin-like